MAHARQALVFGICAAAGFASAQRQLERVEITGSYLPRIGAETALPVQIIRRDEIERSGATHAEDVIARLSANFGSFNEAMGISDRARNGLSGASLRGLGEGATLVLLNGRRLSNFALSGRGSTGVDLHAIPLSAIDRIEVLKDGASALYGSDAMAGVINFITRRDYQGAEVSASYGDSEHGGGGRKRTTLTWGTGDQSTRGFNVFGVLDVQEAKGLRAIDRSFASTSYRPDLGIDNTLFASFPANIETSIDERFPLANPTAPACTPDTVFHPGIGGCWYDYAKDINLLHPSRQANLLVRGAVRVAANTEAYGEASTAWHRVRFREVTSPAAAEATTTGRGFVLPASSPFYPADMGLSGDLSLLYRTAPLGPRISEVTSLNRRLLAGLKGRSFGWDFDAAIVHNDSRATDRFVSGFASASRLRDAIGSGLVNPFGQSGAQGDALLAAAETRGTAREARGRTQSVDLRASRDILQRAAGPWAIAVGAEARRETLTDRPDPRAIDALGPTIYRQSKDGARQVQALYVETVAPLARGVEVQLAARADHYSDFGTSVNPKLALRVQPAPEWLVRSSVGRGFRAPSLPELFTAQTSVFRSADGFPDRIRCDVTHLPTDCAPQVFLISGGNPDLRPERSTQASIGMVAEPNRFLQFSVDAWALRVDDNINWVNPGAVLANLPRYESRNVVRGPVDPAFPNLPGPITRIVAINQNVGWIKMSGIDLAVRLRPVPTPIGRFSMSLDGAYLRSARDQFDGVEQDKLADENNGGEFPRWQHTLTFDLERAPWTVSLSQRYRHGYQDFTQLPDGSFLRVPAYRVWNAYVGYELSRQWRLALGVKNLLDREPPFTNGFNLQTGYEPAYADPRGRFWTLVLTARWD